MSKEIIYFDNSGWTIINRWIKDNKYLNKVKVVSVYYNAEACESDVFIEVGGYNLKCFRGSSSKEDFKKGEICIVQLTLMTTDRKKLTDKEKDIKTEELKGTYGGTYTHCNLKGQIVVIYEINGCHGGYDCAVVDCGGIFVGVEVAPKDNFKIGDYIEAEGRLDIYKIAEEQKDA